LYKGKAAIVEDISSQLLGIRPLPDTLNYLGWLTIDGSYRAVPKKFCKPVKLVQKFQLRGAL
jgi:hypothetical protein